MTAAGRDAWRLIGELWFGGEMQERFHAACATADISPPQLKALLSLEPGEGQPMRDLAQTWHCDASWVTGLVDGLEERGYVERQAYPKDRRIKVIALTALGEKVKAEALDVLHEPPPSLDVLTAAEQRQLRDLVTKVAQHITRVD
jgi:DNA-binding MarR family transcriptional regulator